MTTIELQTRLNEYLTWQAQLKRQLDRAASLPRYTELSTAYRVVDAVLTRLCLTIEANNGN